MRQLMRQLLRLLRRYPRSAIAGGTVATGLLVFTLVWFQPQKLFLSKTVHEAEPTVVMTPIAQHTPIAQPKERRGTFSSLEHPTTGTARLITLADGSVVLRLEGFRTSNGPDLHVLLSRTPSGGNIDYARDGIDLGTLKGNRGDQNYRIPSGTNLETFRSVVIWCKRFKVGFGVASLN